MKKKLSFILVSTMFLSGCNTVEKVEYTTAEFTASKIPETAITTVASKKEITSASAVPVTKNKDYKVVNHLSEFAVEPRRLNEAGAKRAADSMSDKLENYGWIVSKEEFPVYRYTDVISEPYNLGGDSEIMGTGVNVIADMPRYDENKRTLILSAHYDTTAILLCIIRYLL